MLRLHPLWHVSAQPSHAGCGGERGALWVALVDESQLLFEPTELELPAPPCQVCRPCARYPNPIEGADRRERPPTWSTWMRLSRASTIV